MPTDDAARPSGLARSIEQLFSDAEAILEPALAGPPAAAAVETRRDPLGSDEVAGVDEAPVWRGEPSDMSSADLLLAMDVLPSYGSAPSAGADDMTDAELMMMVGGEAATEEPEAPAVPAVPAAPAGPAAPAEAALPPLPVEPPLPHVDLSGLSDAEREQRIRDATDQLERSVTRYLLATPSRRAELAGDIRTHAAVLREAKVLDAQADAVERLVLGAGEPPDPAAVALAQRIASTPVASRIAARLGASREGERREILLRVAKRLGPDMAAVLADALPDTHTDRSARRNYVDAIVGMGAAGLAAAERMVQDRQWFVVRNGAAILGEIGGEAAIAHLTSTLGHSDPRVRKEALVALAKIGGHDAAMLAQGMLEDPDEDVLAAAAMAVGTLKVQRAQRRLIVLLEDPHDDVRLAALKALGQLGDPGAVTAIEKSAVGKLFSRPKAEVRVAAYRALAAIGTPHAKELLEAATEDKDHEVRAAVRSMLGRR